MPARETVSGHRSRLREKFIHSGLDAFHDYEVIELLLTLGMPRKDCKQIAKKALKRFGSLRGVMEASPDELSEIEGLGSKNIFGLRLAQAISRRYLAERIKGRDFLRSSHDVLSYLSLNLRDRSREVFMVIFLNGRNQILAVEELFEGTLSTSAVYPREVIKRALRNKAAALVFVHNHPSGNNQPSKEDLKITTRLKEAASAIDVVVHDHIIISGDDYYSFSDRGLL